MWPELGARERRTRQTPRTCRRSASGDRRDTDRRSGRCRRPARASLRAERQARPSAAKATVSDAPTAVPDGDDIRCEGDTCHVQRRLIESLLENPEQLARLARIVPVQDGGRTIGFRLMGIRRDSLIEAVGFQNGDLVTQVNGKAANSVDAMMSLAMSLKTEETFTIELRRDEKTTTLIILFE